MLLEYKYRDEVTTRIEVDYSSRTVHIENYTDVIMKRAFGVNENPSFSGFEEFLEDRCFPRQRYLMKLHLRELGLDYYDPLDICKKTNGRLEGDFFSIEFLEE